MTGSQVVATINPALYPKRRSADAARRHAAARELVFTAGAGRRHFYYRGERAHNAWAPVARNGDIIILDGGFEYSTVDEIHKGLQFLGLDLNRVKYQIISHAHGDHDGGVYLTERAIPGITII